MYGETERGREKNSTKHGTPRPATPLPPPHAVGYYSTRHSASVGVFVFYSYYVLLFDQEFSVRRSICFFTGTST